MLHFSVSCIQIYLLKEQKLNKPSQLKSLKRKLQPPLYISQCVLELKHNPGN